RVHEDRGGDDPLDHLRRGRGSRVQAQLLPSQDVITDAEYFPVFEGIRVKCPALRDIVIYRSDKPVPGTHRWEEILAGSSPELAGVEIDPLDPAQMLFTSGTTARRKGVLLTHANFLYIGEICARSFAVTPDDRYLLVLPLFHVNAQCISYFPCLTA